MAHYQSRPLPFKLQLVYLSIALIKGRDIEVMSQHLLFSVPSVLMSRPQNDVATSLSSYSSSICVATSILGCDLSTLQLISFFPTIFQVATSR